MSDKPIVTSLNITSGKDGYSIFAAYGDKTHVISDKQWPLGDSQEVVAGGLKEGLAALALKFDIPAQIANVRLNLDNPLFVKKPYYEKEDYTAMEVTPALLIQLKNISDITEQTKQKTSVVGGRGKTIHFDMENADSAKLFELLDQSKQVQK